jgi:hypothetical protein
VCPEFTVADSGIKIGAVGVAIFLPFVEAKAAVSFSIDDTAVSVNGGVTNSLPYLSEKGHEVTQLLVTDVWRRTGDALDSFRADGRPGLAPSLWTPPS